MSLEDEIKESFVRAKERFAREKLPKGERFWYIQSSIDPNSIYHVELDENGQLTLESKAKIERGETFLREIEPLFKHVHEKYFYQPIDKQNYPNPK